MKKIILSITLALVSLGSATASEIVLNCDRSPTDLNRILRTGPGQYQIFHEQTYTSRVSGEKDVRTNVYDLILQGKLTGEKYAMLVSSKLDGKSYVSIALESNADGIQQIQFNDESYGGSEECKAGVGYPALLADLVGVPVYASDEYQDFMDSELAFKCVTTTPETFKIRAVKYSFARLEVQVKSSLDASSRGATLAAFQESALGTVHSVDPTASYYPPIPAGTKLEISRAADVKGKFKAKFFDGAHDKSLSCTKLWAAGNIEEAIAEVKMIAKTLPKKAGTLKDVNLALTSTEVRKIQNIYSRVIMDTKGVHGIGVSVFRADDPQNPYGKQEVWYLTIDVTAAEAKTVQALIGDSIGGARIVYDIGDTAELQ